MKILQIINDTNLSNGGAQHICLNLHKELLNRNIDAELVGISPMLGGDPVVSKCRSLNAKLYSFSAFRKVVKRIKKEEPSTVIHVHLFPAVLYVTLAKRLGYISNKILFTEHSTNNNRRDKWYGKMIDKFIYKKVDLIAAISLGTQMALFNWLHEISSKISVIYNGLDDSTEITVIPFPTKSETLKLVSIGRLIPLKNYELAIQVVSKLKGNGWNVEYQIIGTGSHISELLSVCKKYGVEKNVHFLGYQHEPERFMRDSHIFIMPSFYEGFGLSALKAIKMGLPALVSNVNGLKELAHPEVEQHVLFNSDSPQELYDRIENLLSTESNFRFLIQKQHLHGQNFTLTKMVNNYIKLYQRLN